MGMQEAQSLWSSRSKSCITPATMSHAAAEKQTLERAIQNLHAIRSGVLSVPELLASIASPEARDELAGLLQVWEPRSGKNNQISRYA